MLHSKSHRRFKMVRNIELKDLSSLDDVFQLIKNLKPGEDQFVLNEDGEPKAALLSVQDLELLQNAKQNKKEALKELFSTLDAVHERNAHIPEEEVHADVAEAIAAVRQERRK